MPILNRIFGEFNGKARFAGIAFAENNDILTVNNSILIF